MTAPQPAPTSTTLVTVPNVLSALRLLLIPVFVYVVFGQDALGWGVLILIVAGVSDFLDGFLARRWNQVSAVGTLLDPLADRLTGVVVPVVLALTGIMPWPVVVALLTRDLVVLVGLLRLRRTGQVGLPVTFIGKAATFALLSGFPLLLLGAALGGPNHWVSALGWISIGVGLVLYWWSAVVYLSQVRTIVELNR